MLILDEPTSGLDPLVQQEVAKLLEEAVAEGRTVFFSSHVLPEVERLSHAVAIIREGLIVAVEDIARLKSRAVHVLEVTFAEPPPLDLFALPGVRELHRDGNTVHIQALDGLDAAIKAMARLPRRRPADGAAEPGGLLPRPLLGGRRKREQRCATG